MDKYELKIRELEDQIRKYQDSYYKDNQSLITDKEFDSLLKKLQSLEDKYPQYASEDSPTKTIGSDLSNQFEKFKHTIPVLSLENTYNLEELEEWTNKHSKESLYSLEWKIDGASIVLYYDKGKLQRAVTRGNGGVGDDVTENVKTIRSIPLSISDTSSISIRGEIFISFKDFEEFNNLFDNKYANPRNLASGSLKNKYPSETAKRPLNIFLYDIHFSKDEIKINTQKEVFEFLEKNKFPIAPGLEVVNSKEFSKKIPIWEKKKDKLPFPTDGLVIKINDLNYRETLGFTSHSPRWARAYKFDAIQKETTIEEITVAVGRTGKITPRAKVTPVSLAGTTVTYATLHNKDYIDELGVGIGATVLISKRGEIIPAVEKVIKKGKEVYPFPTKCPSCNSKLQKQGDSVDYFCMNTDCKDKLKNLLQFFCHRSQMDIEGLGEKQVEVFFNLGLIKSIPDLYKLHKHKDQIKDLDGFGEKSIQIILDGIEKSKKKPFRTVIHSLGLNEIGPKVAEILVENHYNSIKKLFDLVKEKNATSTLAGLFGIGEKTAIAIVDQLKDPKVKNTFQELEQLGLNMEEDVLEKPSNGIFMNQSWCVTGSFENFQPRDIAMDIIIKNGGKKVSGVSSKTTHLLYGPGAGSKLEKATELGVSLISEEDFLKILNDNGIQY